MKIFIDSANISEIRKWLGYGIADGVTTNPSIMFKDGVYDVEKGAKKIGKREFRGGRETSRVSLNKRK